MHDLATGANNTGTLIPFWLQIVSIAAAPILGFVGVAVGVALNEQNRRAAYFVEEKKKVYLEFINTLAAIHAFWANEVGAILRDPVKAANAHRIASFSDSRMETLNRTYAQLLLFGSQPVVEEGAKCSEYALTVSLTAVVMLTRGIDEKRWAKAMEEATKLIRDFTRAARRDLGLPKLSLKEYELTVEMEKKYDEFIEGSLRAFKERFGFEAK